MGLVALLSYLLQLICRVLNKNAVLNNLDNVSVVLTPGEQHSLLYLCISEDKVLDLHAGGLSNYRITLYLRDTPNPLKSESAADINASKTDD